MVFADIDEQITNKIKELLEAGVLEKDAGPMTGISKATYFNWKKDIPEFRTLCVSAVLEYKRKLVMAVNVNSVKDGKVAMEMLRTRWPNDYNVAKKIAMVDPEKEIKKTLAILEGEEVELDDEEIMEEDADVEDSNTAGVGDTPQLPPANPTEPQNQG